MEKTIKRLNDEVGRLVKQYLIDVVNIKEEKEHPLDQGEKEVID